MYTLTPKEIETCVSFLKNKGHTNKVAADLKIKQTTTKTHLANIYKKLSVNTSEELTQTLYTSLTIPIGLNKYSWLKKAKTEYADITIELLKNFNLVLKMPIF